MKNRILIIVLQLFLSLGLYAQCYEVYESNSGELNLYNMQLLDDAACDVQNFLGSNEFKIYGADLYPIQAFVDEGKGFEILFNRTIEELNIAEGYLVIVKEHHLDNSLNYRVHVKYSSLNAFTDIDEIGKLAIINDLENTLNIEANKPGFKIIDNSGIEKKTMERFLWLLNGGVNEVKWKAAGFKKINFDDHAISISVDASTGDKPNVLDYAGVINNETGDYLREDANFTSQNSYFNPIIIFTSDIDNVSSSSFNQAKDNFDTLGDDFIFWFHFPNENTGFYKIKTNISIALAKENIDNAYEEHIAEFVSDSAYEDGDSYRGNEDSKARLLPNCEQQGGCPLSITKLKKWSAYCCLFPNLPDNEFRGGFSLGLVDGILQTVFFLYEIGGGLQAARDNSPFSLSWWGDALWQCYLEGSFYEGFKSKIEDTVAFWTDISTTVKAVVNGLSFEDIKEMVILGFKDFVELANPFISGLKGSGYVVGVIGFEVLLAYFTGGASGIKKIAKISDFTKVAFQKIKSLSSPEKYRYLVREGFEQSKATTLKLRCILLSTGCFVKDTPVLLANKNCSFTRNPFRNNLKTLAVAAAMPIVAVPIQEVQLLDYVVAHESVNSTFGITAITDEDIYLELTTDKDSYTSDQQVERNQYELDDENWNEVVFEEVYGSSTAKFALHQNWVDNKGYKVKCVVNLDLPEQGISGPFKITSIKHIIPQKKPTDEHKDDDYDYRPVTALFTHVSNQVYNIEFDSGESLGITYQHPIYSVSEGDWRLAGELKIGEIVLTFNGETTITNSTKKEGAETVYNLEVKELHNFLVGKTGIVAHNNYANILNTFIDGIYNATKNYHANFKCVEFSKALRNYYKSKGHNITTKRIELVGPDGKIDGVMSYIDANGQAFQISNNGIHEFTRINNKIFDNNNPLGVLDSEYFSKFAVQGDGYSIRQIDIKN